MEISEEEVVIIGGGIAGLATAVALKRVGIRALVLERSPELRTTGAALTLFPNAWLALQALGVAHKLTSIYSPLPKGYVTNVANGAVRQVSYQGINGKSSGPIAVHRRALLETLAAELTPGTIRFSSKLTSIRTVAMDDQVNSSAAIINLDDGTVISAKVLIGCDGLHSVVARWLGLKDPVDSTRSSIRALAVFPEGHGYKQEIYQFIDQGKRAGVVPLNDKELYWFVTYDSIFNGDKNAASDPKLLQRYVIENLAKDFPSAFLEVVQHADLETMTWAPLMLRVPWDLIFGPVNKGCITVAGDAMHPMTPDLGQGGGSALEDAVVLGRHLGNSFLSNQGIVSGDEIAKAIQGYVKERRWRTATLITGSYLTGSVNQSGSSSWINFLRDTIFYKFLYCRVFAIDATNYDCGKLPSVSSPAKSDDRTKID